MSTLTRATSAETTRGLRASLVAVHTFTLEIDDTDAGGPAAFASHSAADASGRPTQQRGLQPMSRPFLRESPDRLKRWRRKPSLAEVAAK